MTRKKSKMGSKKGSFFKDSSIYVLANVGSVAITLVTLPIFTRYLSPADYGIVVLFMMFGQISAGLLSIGLHNATYRYYFKYKDNIERFKILNSTNILFNLFIFLIFGLFITHMASWLSSSFFDGRITETIIRLSFLSGCINYFCTYFTHVLIVQIRSVPFSIVTVSGAVIRVVFTFYFIFIHSLTYMALIYATLFSQGIMLVCLVILTRDFLGLRFSSSSLKKSLKFSYPQTPVQLMGLAYSSFDKLLLNKYTGLMSVGYYSFGARFADLMKIVMDSVGKVFNPFFLTKAHENTEAAKKAIIKRFYELSFLFMFGGLAVICFSEEMIKLLTTKEYYPAMYVVPVYVFYHLFGILGFLSMMQIMFVEKLYYEIPVVILSLIINIILNILLIPKFGAVGAAVATAIAALFGNTLGLYYGLRLYPLPLQVSKLVGLYILIFVFTAIVYPTMAIEINFMLKIVIKLLLLFLFVIFSIKLNYGSSSRIRNILSRIFHRDLKFS